MAEFLDTFTVASDTLLTARTPDTGTGWAVLDSTFTAGNIYAKVTGGSTAPQVCGPDTNQNSVGIGLKATPAPTGAEYDVETRVYSHNWTIGNSYTRGFFGRKQAGVKTMYAVRVYPNGHTENSVALYHVNAGSATELASFDATLTNGSLLKLEIRDAAKKVYLDGVEILSSGDNSITGAGEAGLFFGNIFGVGSHIDRRQEFDDFSLTLAGGGGTGPVTATPASGTWKLSAGNPSAIRGALTLNPGLARLRLSGPAASATRGALIVVTGSGLIKLTSGPTSAVMGAVAISLAIGGLKLAGGPSDAIMGPLAATAAPGTLRLGGGLVAAQYGALTLALPAGRVRLLGLAANADTGGLFVVPVGGRLKLTGSGPLSQYGALSLTLVGGRLAVSGPNPVAASLLVVSPARGAFLLAGAAAQATRGALVAAVPSGRLRLVAGSPATAYGALLLVLGAGRLALRGGPLSVLIGQPPQHARSGARLTRTTATLTTQTTTATAHIIRGRVSVLTLYDDPDE